MKSRRASISDIPKPCLLLRRRIFHTPVAPAKLPLIFRGTNVITRMNQHDAQQRREMLTAIIDSSDDAIISKDLNSLVTSWNKAAEKMFGYRQDEIVGRHIQVLIPDDRKQEEDMIISKLKNGERIDHYETVRVTKQGVKIFVSITVSPIKGPEGFIVGASKIARDITKQKHDQQLIKKYAERLLLINSIGKTISSELNLDVILQRVIDATTIISGAAFGAFIYKKNSAVNSSDLSFALSGLSIEKFEQFFSVIPDTERETIFSHDSIIRIDDMACNNAGQAKLPTVDIPFDIFPATSYMTVPVMSSTDNISGSLIFGHPSAGVFLEEHEDLVEAIASQAAIALDNARLFQEVQALNTKKNDFIGFASHELKTPLATIKGYLQLAQSSGEPIPGILEKMQKQVSRLEGIISDLLDISKIESGHLELNLEATSLHTLLRESVETVNLSHHVFEMHAPEKDVTVFIDGQKMAQVLINTIGNAVKYSSPGTRIVLAAEHSGNTMHFSVSDEGVGMSPDHLNLIFNQYYRVRQSKSAEGMGLGLFISKEIIEKHLGKIWAESEPGKGFAVHFTVPVEDLFKSISGDKLSQ